MEPTDDSPLLYDELASWWPLLSAPDEYEEEAGIYTRALREMGGESCRTVLELGCGGGNNASHMKRHFELTLTDRSAGMLEVSRALNPECEHVQGDMRSLRLRRTFDAVFVHDAVAYLTSEDDLAKAMATAAAHLRPGGVALFVPDDTTESFRSETRHGGHDGEDGRGLRYMTWTLPRGEGSSGAVVHYAYLLREPSGKLRSLYDIHHVGLFPRSTWMRLIAGAGFEPRALPYEHSLFRVPHEMFAGVRT